MPRIPAVLVPLRQEWSYIFLLLYTAFVGITDSGDPPFVATVLVVAFLVLYCLTYGVRRRFGPATHPRGPQPETLAGQKALVNDTPVWALLLALGIALAAWLLGLWSHTPVSFGSTFKTAFSVVGAVLAWSLVAISLGLRSGLAAYVRLHAPPAGPGGALPPGGGGAGVFGPGGVPVPPVGAPVGAAVGVGGGVPQPALARPDAAGTP